MSIPKHGDRMTTLYRPVRIKTAEQAEALPIGTIATREDYYPVEKWLHDTDVSRVVIWGDRIDPLDHEDLIDWTALVPIEAVEETRDPSDLARRRGAIPLARLVTPWEEA